MRKEKTIKGLFTLVASRNKNTKKIEKTKVIKAKSKRSPKGEPMSNPLSYPEQIGYQF